MWKLSFSNKYSIVVNNGKPYKIVGKNLSDQAKKWHKGSLFLLWNENSLQSENSVKYFKYFVWYLDIWYYLLSLGLLGFAANSHNLKLLEYTFFASDFWCENSPGHTKPVIIQGMSNPASYSATIVYFAYLKKKKTFGGCMGRGSPPRGMVRSWM